MKIGATPYFQPQPTHEAARAPALPTDDNQQSGGSASSVLDFTSMSRSVLRDTVNSLIKSGKLSLDDTTGLVGIMGPAVTTTVDGSAPPAGYESQSINAFAELKAGIEGARSRNDLQNEAVLMRTLSALQRLQGMVVGLDVKA